MRIMRGMPGRSVGRRHRARSGRTGGFGVADRGVEIFGRQDFDFDQLGRKSIEHVAVVFEKFPNLRVRRFDDAADFGVDAFGGAVGHLALRRFSPAEEGVFRAGVVGHGAEFVGHAEAADDGPREAGDLLQVVRGAGRTVVEDDLFRGAPAEGHADARQQLFARDDVPIFGRQRQRVAERALAARDDRNLRDRVGVRRELRHEGMAQFVVRQHLLFFRADDLRLAFGAGDRAFDRLFHLALRNVLAAAASGEQRRFVHDVRKIGALEKPGVRFAISESSTSDVSGLPRAWILRIASRPRTSGSSNTTSAVEATGARERGIEDVGTIRGRDDDHALTGVEAVHLDEELVQRLFAFVVAAAHARAAMATHRVDFVDEDDARGLLLRRLEKIADARGTHADEHFDEVGAGDREERHTGFTGDRTGEEGLAAARRTHQKDAARDLAAEGGETVGFLEEFDDFGEFLLRFVRARDVVERHAGLVFADDLRLRTTEGKHVLALHARGAEHEEEDEEQDERQPEDRATSPIRIAE
jgi:hypothetical protein